MRLAVFILVLQTFCAHAQNTIATRFKVPPGYVCETPAGGTFAAYLSNLSLKPPGTLTRTHTGAVALTDAYTAAVVDMSIGERDLQQCADAVMRLRAEYLYAQKRYAEISFHFVSGFKCDYVKYAEGNRFVNGKWVPKAKKDYSYPTFMRYMELVYSYASTLSLQKELQKVNDAATIQTGDVFIQGGSPGHCFIVVQVAKEIRGAKKKFMLAQSYMPAQNIQVLINGDSPWFELNGETAIPYSGLIHADFLRRFP